MKELRRKLWGKATVKVIKNTLTQIALDQVKSERPELQKLKDMLTDMHALVLTNGDIFEIARTINSIKEKRSLKPGKISPTDVIIKKGFTGFRPGPEMSELRMAGVPVRIFDGEVYVQQDYVLVRSGQVVSPYAARVMAILDIKPLEVGPEVIIGITDGYIIGKEVLLRPLQDYIADLRSAIYEAHTLAIEAKIPISEILEELLMLASKEASALLRETALISEDTIQDLTSLALREIVALLGQIAGGLPEIPNDLKELISVTPSVEKKEEKTEKEEKKKPEERKEKEEEGLAGLRLLF